MSLVGSLDPLRPLDSLSDSELLTNVQRLTARSNVALADLLAHLGEVEARGIHRTRACASLYTYCIYELRMSEDAAFRRSKAARLVREHPELRDAIARGELHLTGVLMIGPHLGGERHAEILQRSRFRSKRELACLVAEIDPRADVPTLVSPLGPAPARRPTHEAYVAALSGPVRSLLPGRRPEDWMEDGMEGEMAGEGVCAADGMTATGGGAGKSDMGLPSTATENPMRYRVQFTASQELVDLLSEVSDLLGHESPRPSLPEIHLRALRALAKHLRSQKRAATARPRSPKVPREGATGVVEGGSADTSSATLPRGASTADDTLDALARVGSGNSTPGDALARVGSADPTKVDAPARASRGSSRRAPARTSSPSRTSTFARDPTRYIPAAVRREVWGRDGARCAYVDDRGERCRETFALEIHHGHPHALGGPPTLGNLELRCRAHNILAAEQDFGRAHMDRMR